MTVYLQRCLIEKLTKEHDKEDAAAALLLNVAEPAEATCKMAATESHSETQSSNDTFIELQRIQEAIEEE